MKHCSKCDLTFPDASAFCKKCGGPISDDEVTVVTIRNGGKGSKLICPSCGKPHREGAVFCKGCGKPLDPLITNQAFHSERIRESETTLPRTPTLSPPAARSIAASTEPDVTCGKCGTRNKAGMRFCKTCRAPIGELAKKVRTKRIVAGVVAGLALFATVSMVLGWYLWGVKVTLESDPVASKVFIDGREVGITNASGVVTVPHIRAGDHDLVVMHEGFDNWKQPFHIAFTDFSKTLTVKLNPTKYKLTIISSPTGSEVLVDNQSMGSTSDSNGNLETSPLASGDYSVIVRHDGYRDWKQNVSLKGAHPAKFIAEILGDMERLFSLAT